MISWRGLNSMRNMWHYRGKQVYQSSFVEMFNKTWNARKKGQTQRDVWKEISSNKYELSWWAAFNPIWRAFLTPSFLIFSFICLCHGECSHVRSAERRFAFLLCCAFPATIRLHCPQVPACPPGPYGKASKAGSELQDPTSVTSFHVFSKNTNIE